MATRTRKAFRGAAIGAIPGVALYLVGILVGGEAMLSFGVIGIMVAIVGLVVGAVVGASTGGEHGGNAPVVGAIIGAVPGVVLIFVQTRLAFAIMLIGALAGWFIGTRLSRGGSPPDAAI